MTPNEVPDMGDEVRVADIQMLSMNRQSFEATLKGMQEGHSADMEKIQNERAEQESQLKEGHAREMERLSADLKALQGQLEVC